jgi:hypothetical protein
MALYAAWQRVQTSTDLRMRRSSKTASEALTTTAPSSSSRFVRCVQERSSRSTTAHWANGSLEMVSFGGCGPTIKKERPTTSPCSESFLKSTFGKSPAMCTRSPHHPADERLFREKKFAAGRHGPDVLICDDDAVVVCEIGANEVNVRDTLHRGSVDALDKDIERVLLPRVEQVRKKIDALRSGAFSYPRAISESTRIEPVVCLLDGFPIAPYVRNRIDDAVTASRLLDVPNVGRIAILSAEEFELACATVESRSGSMSGLLSGMPPIHTGADGHSAITSAH